MEDHIIAAHCALIIGYMILTDQMFSKAAGNKKNKIINIDKAKNEMKDHSFKFMSQIIRKFLVFMKLMVGILVYLEINFLHIFNIFF